MKDLTVAIASDHGGYDQKKQLVSWMLLSGVNIHDLGPYTNDPVDYPDFAKRVADEIVTGIAELGVLVCGTGIGMAITANKFPGIRAANVTTPEFAALAREHNDANIIAISGRFVDFETNKTILRKFFSTSFGEGRHAVRVDKIKAFEELLSKH